MAAVDLLGEPLAAREDQGSLFGESRLKAPEERDDRIARFSAELARLDPEGGALAG